MSFVKWLRKNNQKIMVWVVVVIMITFVGGFSLRQLLSSRGPSKKAIASIDGEKINALDRMEAISELEILRDMGAGQVLASQSLPGRLIAQLIFPDSGSASMLDAQLKYAAMQGQLTLDNDAVQAFFEANKGDAPIYWILLNKEAQDLGCAVSSEKAMEVYKNIASVITRGQGQASTIVANLSSQHKVPQEVIIEIFAKLLSVTAYIDSTIKAENVTLPEIASQIGYSTEKINSTYVEFRANNYTKGIEEVPQEMINKQFEEYKNYFAGDITENNPYGFGYKIPDRVKLEYVILKLDDVETLIQQPTEEEMENHYTRNKSNFTEEVKKDPSNPDSETETRIKSYAEVRDQIKSQLVEQRTNARAELIMNDIKAEVGKKLLDKDTESMTGEQIKQFAGDYSEAAKNASAKSGITVYSGSTGFLSRKELRSDRNLGRLSEQKPSRMPVELITKAFAVQGLEAEKLSKFDGVAPKIYQNIGPMQGMYPKTLALVRVVDYKTAQVPENIDAAYDITKSEITGQPKEEIFTVKEAVSDDCKTLMAMETAKVKAEKFIETAGDDWEAAKEAYNKDAENDIFVNDMKDRNRVSELDIQKARTQAKASSMAMNRLEYTIKNKMMMDKIYEMKDAQLPAVAELPASKSVIAVKNVEVTKPTTEDYDSAKKETASAIESTASIKAAFIQLNADNIIARTNFEYVKDEEKADTQEQE
ncbi:MAG: hypothetical protein ACIAQZ_07070 [Sedimentisphaeraceae bacterium JB056]